MKKRKAKCLPKKFFKRSFSLREFYPFSLCIRAGEKVISVLLHLRYEVRVVMPLRALYEGG